MNGYVHGYSGRESTRLKDQADTLSRLLHEGTAYPPGSKVLECGCGTGAQTVYLAASSPRADILSVDISDDSLKKASEKMAKLGVGHVRFQQEDVFQLSLKPESVDHVFVCFLLEHLRNPEKALKCLKRVLKPGGSLTVIEGDHGSWYCHPETSLARKTVDSLIRIQAAMGGDALVGRRLFPLLAAAGFEKIRVEPKMVYVDSSRPDLVEGFSKNTFIAMVEAVREKALERGLMGAEEWEQGIRDLCRATEKDGTFCYTFFKACARK